MSKTVLTAAVALGLLAMAPKAQAVNLLVSRTDYTEGLYGYGYGEGNSLLLTSALDTKTGGHVTVATSFGNAAQVQAADALWLDQRQPSELLSAGEVANLQAFIATGRRVVLIGENHNWTNWDNQILGIVGGSYGGDGFDAVPVVSNSLTAGVNTVQFETAGVIIGGTALFNPASAALFGPQNNVLVMLDTGPLTDFFRTSANLDNSQFAENIATWITTPVPTPEPATASVFLLGAAAALLSPTRRRSR